MLRWTRVRFDLPFRDRKLNDAFQLIIAKKEIEFDYIGIDVSGLVGTGLRMAKTTPEPRKYKEVARHVVQHLHQVLKKFHARKGLGLFLDGSETLYKAHLNRSANMTRRLESRLQRLPFTVLMQTVEDRVIRMMPENRTFPREVVFSGTCVPGPVEVKMSAWSLDVASRDILTNSTSSVVAATTNDLCLIGASELYLNSLALTPFNSVTSVVQNNSDFKQLRLRDLLEWLALDTLSKSGSTAALSRVRTDVLFLMMLTQGCSTSELSPILLTFGDAMGAYYNHLQLMGSTTPPEEKFLFVEEPGGPLRLRVAAFEAVLSKAVKRNASGSPPAKVCSVCAGYLEMVLQSHHMICLGHIADTYVMPSSSASPNPQALLLHLHALLQSNVSFVSASQSAKPPLTAAEYSILSQSQSLPIESAITHLVGMTPKEDVARSIASDKLVESASVRLRDVLSFVNPAKAPKALHFSPSYCWLQNERNKLWTFEYVDIGCRSKAVDGRRLKGLVASASANFSVSSDGPCVFNMATQQWTAIPQFPYEGIGQNLSTEASATQPTPSSEKQRRTLKILTWNVMFDRYSGKPTPLGMPGIDWCSPKRYPVLSNVMERSNADVIGMQEVEPQFWEYLAAQPWVRDNYVLSCNASGPPITPWGVFMMVHRRNKVVHLTHHNIPAWSGHVSLMPVVTLMMGGQPLHVAAIHLLAPFTKGRESARTGQDNALRLKMTKAITGDCITMGDFNDWPTNEFVMSPELNYVDAWPLLHPQDLGKTMDETNTFCKLKIEEIFFGRSDKVFFRSKRLRPTHAQLVGIRSVNDDNGNQAAPAYLFPSDHYGVEMTFEVTGV